MSSEISFGQWLKQRRKALGLAQGELARQVGCATITLQKIEAGERQPSRQIAERLAEALAIEPDRRGAFIEFAHSHPASGASLQFRAPSNLPVPATPLIGRERDVADVCKRLMRDDTRLLTLVGPPGIGKTRLALQVASEVRDEFDDGAFLVPLAPISDSNLVLSTVGQTLKLVESSNRPWLDRLNDYLQFRQMLLVLDNFEQVVSAAPHLAKLLAACPLLKVLVTSRAALRVRAERQFFVPPLALPDLARLPAVDALIDHSAVAMFLDRAQAVAPEFEISEANASAVAHICHRLDGVPLALELIAVRVQVLSPQALLERLSGQLLLQSDSLRDTDERQRTLRNAITWSYNLLTPTEQRLVRRLGVFVGGWTLEATERICTDADRNSGETGISQGPELLPASQLLDTMTSLVNKSMVERQVYEGEPRFTLLETIREYALEQLEASHEAQALKRRHAEYFLALAQEASSHFEHAGEARWLNRVDRERANVRAALAWAYQANETVLASELAMTFHGLAYYAGLLNEACDWLVRALSIAGALSVPQLVRARLLNTTGINSFLRGDYASALEYHEKALSLASELEDTNEIANSLFLLALAIHNMGDNARAETLWLAALPLARKCGNRWIEGMSLGNLSSFARARGDIDRAMQLCDDAVRLMREIDDALFATMWLNYQGAMMRQQGRYAEATAIHFECLRTTYAIGSIREVCDSLERLASVAAAKGDQVRAARLLGAAQALRQKCGTPIDRAQKADYDEALSMARARLDVATFDTAWAEGRVMTMEQAVEYALGNE